MMNSFKKFYKTVILVSLLVISPLGISSGMQEISIQRVPDDGILQYMVNDNQGGVHLVYFKQLENADYFRDGHIYYSRYLHQDQEWTDAIQISHVPFSQLGAIARPEIAIDQKGRVHVTWLDTESYSFMYARSDPDTNRFEMGRALVQVDPEGVETSASISVHENTVTLVWHAGGFMDEASRTVYAVSSYDNGETFMQARQIGNPSLGACACCGQASGYVNDELLVGYRSAVNGTGRHMQLLRTTTGPDGTGSGDDVNTHLIDEWTLSACPVSTNHIASHRSQDKEQSWLVFETKGVLYQYDAGSDTSKVLPVRESSNELRQKNPSTAITHSGERLIVWGEGNGISNGGILNMQLYSPDNTPLSTMDPGIRHIPDHSIAAVSTTKSGSFIVLY